MVNTPDKFWSHVDKSGECWEWQGYCMPSGYGHWRYKGKTHLCHRLSWMFTNGEISDGLCVCHHCDNPKCVKPDHLFLGTHADNVRDKVTKGRARGKTMFGEDNPASKLDKRQVRRIRHLRKECGFTLSRLAELYDVSIATIHRVIDGTTWSNVS